MPVKSKKKAAKEKKEVLADPSTLKDGTANHYIGGWSYLQDFADVTEISHKVVAAHTAEDRNVAALPRTNVLLLPPHADDMAAEEVADAEDAAAHDDVAPEIIEVADKMQIEGVSNSVLRSQQGNIKSWEREPEPEPAKEEAPAVSADPAAAVVTVVDPADPEAAADPAAVPTAPEMNPEGAVDADGPAAAPPPPPGVEGEEQPPEEKVPPLPRNPLEAVTTTFGADFVADDVHLHGPVDIVGVLPQIVVKPNLPTPPKRPEEEIAAQKKGSKKKGSAASRRKSAKQKLTPEQLAELEQKKAEEEALFLKETEEAIALAAAQEDYLMTFAHPNLWASVTISKVTFTGPVVVRRAHVVFQNCRFTSHSATKPQLTISQYCNVQCIKCTFDAPSRCGLYALPTAQISVKKCLFTGIPHTSIVSLGGEEGRRLAGVAAHASEDGNEHPQEDDNGFDENGEDRAANGIFGAGSSATGEPTMSVELLQASAEAHAARPLGVGIQVDSAKITVDECHFVFLGSGVVLHGRYAFAPPPAANGRGAKRPPVTATTASMVVQGCQFHFLYNTAIVLDAHDVLVRRNNITDCEYYALDCRGSACRSVSIQGNTFGFQAIARIREKAQAILVNNVFQSIPVNDNSNDNPCVGATY